FRRFLAKVTECRLQARPVARVFPKRLVVRYRFRLSVDKKFVGVNSPRLAKKRRAPLPEMRVQSFRRHALQLADRLNPNISQRAFGHPSDSRNSSHWQRRQKLFLAS